MKVFCSAVQESMPLFVYADLPPAEMGRIGIHIGGCPACSGEHDGLRSLLQRVDAYVPRALGVDVDAVVATAAAAGKQAAGEPAPAPASTNPGAWGTAILFAAILALFGGLVWQANSSDRVPPESPEQDPPQVPPEEDTPADSPTLPAPSEPVQPQVTATPPSTAPVPDLRRARHLLTIYQADPDRDPVVLRRRLQEVSVSARAFLLEAVRTTPAATARTALQALLDIDRAEGLEAAGSALRQRDDLDELACQLLGESGSTRAVDLLDQSWKPAAEARIANALARLATRRAARALARRIERADQVTPEVWDAFCSLGALAAEPACKLIEVLPADLRPRALDLVASAKTRTTHRRLRSLLDDPALALRVAARLAERGDPAGLDRLLEAAGTVQQDPAERTLATTSLTALAAVNPGALAERILADSSEAGMPRHVVESVRALMRGAPAQVPGLVSRLARVRSTAPRALEVARHAGSVEAARALLPLGRNRHHASSAVDIAAALPGDEARPLLFAFLSTRYGAERARDHLTAVAEPAAAEPAAAGPTDTVSMPTAEPE